MATVEEINDVIVIGAGWSGLLSCKYALEENLSVRVIEKREDIGGVWKFSPDPDITTVMKNSTTSSSNTVTEISDFPMPTRIGDFPKHNDIKTYLDEFAQKHNLRRHIHFNTAVKKIYKINHVWYIETENNKEYRGKNVIVCSGVHQKVNNDLEKGLLKDFEGLLFNQLFLSCLIFIFQKFFRISIITIKIF